MLFLSNIINSNFEVVDRAWNKYVKLCQSNMTHCCTPGDFSIKNRLGTLLLQRDELWGASVIEK